MTISVREQMAIRLAAAPYRYQAVRERDARELLGFSPTRFAQVVASLLDRPDALEAEPQRVRQLQRLREVRRAARMPRHYRSSTEAFKMSQ